MNDYRWKHFQQNSLEAPGFLGVHMQYRSPSCQRITFVVVAWVLIICFSWYIGEVEQPTKNIYKAVLWRSRLKYPETQLPIPLSWLYAWVTVVHVSGQSAVSLGRFDHHRQLRPWDHFTSDCNCNPQTWATNQKGPWSATKHANHHGTDSSPCSLETQIRQVPLEACFLAYPMSISW